MKLRTMSKKILSIFFIIIMFLFCSIFIIPHDKVFRVEDVISANTFILNNGKIFKIKGIETFDSEFSTKNENIAKLLNITETDAFLLGNLAKQKASNIMKGRKVYVKNNSDLIYYRYSYKEKFLHSGYCIENNAPVNKENFEQRLLEARRAKYKILDLNSGIIYDLNNPKIKTLNNFIIIRKSHLPKLNNNLDKNIQKTINLGNVKVFMTDFTTNLIPNRDCNSNLCKEILNNINASEKSIEMAIYGYSIVPKIETALLNAQNRGVNIRLVYDLDRNGNNIYPDTKILSNLLKNNMSDFDSKESSNTMHNKFFIFDDKKIITGSANLSHTDMSEYNSNIVISIESAKLANIYKQEFEQMFNGKFHNNKDNFEKEILNINNSKIQTYFSPQDKGVENAIIPLLKKAKNYIYIPTFVLTHNKITEELILAKNRGVEVKIIMDTLSTFTKHSKINQLRNAGITVKTENFAGKMHSKSLFIDDKYTIIGSMNFSNSGENKNDENFLLIENEQITKVGKDFFLYQWEKIDNKWLKQNPRAESVDSIGSCFDGIDNDYDGLIDNAEDACKI